MYVYEFQKKNLGTWTICYMSFYSVMLLFATAAAYIQIILTVIVADILNGYPLVSIWVLHRFANNTAFYDKMYTSPSPTHPTYTTMQSPSLVAAGLKLGMRYSLQLTGMGMTDFVIFFRANVCEILCKMHWLVGRLQMHSKLTWQVGVSTVS